MITIYSPYNRPEFSALSGSGDSITVQGLVTSLSVILNGGDDNNMKSLDLGYSETVRDLYPEMFGHPTKYELAYEQQAAKAYADEMGVSSVVDEQTTPSGESAVASAPSSEEVSSK